MVAVSPTDRLITRHENLYARTSGSWRCSSPIPCGDLGTLLLAETGDRLRARNVLITTGTRPAIAKFEGAELGKTSDDALTRYQRAAR